MNALIAEDYDEIRILLTHLLEDIGFNVRAVTNGKEALTILENSAEPFSLLLTDFNMPYMNGLELIEESFKRNIPIEKIIIFSGMRENEQRVVDLIKKHPHIKFIDKSVSPEKLVEAIIS